MSSSHAPSRSASRHDTPRTLDAAPTPSAPHDELPDAGEATSQGDGLLGGVSVVAAPRAAALRTGSAAAPHLAFVHDWLPVYAGAERVLEQMIAAFPASDVYTLVDFIAEEERAFLQGRPVHTSFMQRLPFAKALYRKYLPLAPLAIEQLDVSAHDIVVSSSYAVAKGVLTRADQLHLSYVHSPIRYAWDLHHEYLREGGLAWGLRSMIARLILHYIRLYDASTALRVDRFAANSQHVARRIWKTYRRPAQVIYPPVDTDAFQLHTQKDDFYLTLSRLVPYKRIDVAVKAFAAMPDKELVVIGDGPEFQRLKAMAGPNVTLLGFQPDEAVRYYMQRARAFVFAAEEDFGIVPVEAQACGTPVIAYGRGGALETVVPGRTGLFFAAQTPDHLTDAVQRFEAQRAQFEPEAIRAHAERFGVARFRADFQAFVEQAAADFAADATRMDTSLSGTNLPSAAPAA